MHASNPALSSHIIGPCSVGAGLVVAVVSQSWVYWAGSNASVGGVVGEGVREGRAKTYATVCRVISVLSALPVAIRNAAVKKAVGELHLRAAIHAKT